MKKIFTILLRILLGLIIAVSLYLLAAVILSRISVAEEAGAPDEVTIYIYTNGVHTDIVLPVRHARMDWNTFIPIAHTTANDTLSQFVAFGWGDKGFYLEAPTLADVKFTTAFKAAFSLSPSAMHVTYYRSMQEGDDCKKILISEAQYARLVTYVKSSFLTDAAGRARYFHTTANYSPYDTFYDARRRYNIFYTCNTWTNNALKSCGQKAGVWTAFDKGIFYHYR